MTKPFWDVEENKRFISIPSSLDKLPYKVIDTGNIEQDFNVAVILSEIRFMVNKLLCYLIKNENLWRNKSIEPGLLHTFDIHIPHWKEYIHEILHNNDYCYLNRILITGCNLFNIQEMTPNMDGIIGLNKPKSIRKLHRGEIIINNNNEIATKRSFHLTIRDISIDPKTTEECYDRYIFKCGDIHKAEIIRNLVIHELTHTVCNDTQWKSDNHQYPYEYYHGMMRKWAKECGVL